MVARRLTARQIDCLRLVLAHYSSKEIARELGISHHTVNKTLEGAMRRVGVGDRVSAARILAAYEHGLPYDHFVTAHVVNDPMGMSSSAGLMTRRPRTAGKSGVRRMVNLSHITGSQVTKSVGLSSIETNALHRATPPHLVVAGIFLIGVGVYLSFRNSIAGRRT